jgi:hypothetical protein
MSPPRGLGWHVCVRCGVVVVIEVERCLDGSTLALRMGGATVPFAERDTRGCQIRDRRCAFLKMFMLHEDCVDISGSFPPVTLTANLSCFNASCFRTWYECPPPRRGRERARQELPRPPLLAIPSRSSVTDTLSAERVLTRKALKGKLKRTRPRGYTEAPAGARGAKHCTVWMGVARALPSQSRNLLATICLDPQLVYGAACTAVGTVRSARRPRR